MRNLESLAPDRMQPIVGNYFHNPAQHPTVLDFLNARSDRQVEAAAPIRAALAAYDVQAIGLAWIPYNCTGNPISMICEGVI